MRNLDEVGPKETHFDNDQRHADEETTRATPIPAVGNDAEKDERGDDHGHGDGNSIRSSKVRRGAEAEN